MRLEKEKMFDIWNFMNLIESEIDCKCTFNIEVSGWPVVEILGYKDDEMEMMKVFTRLKRGYFRNKIVDACLRDTSFEDAFEGFKHYKFAVWFYRCM